MIANLTFALVEVLIIVGLWALGGWWGLGIYVAIKMVLWE